MTYKEETYALNTLEELKERIRDMPNLELLAKEVHENNIMLKGIVKAINTHIAHHPQENRNDFFMNVIANLISSGFDLSKIFNK